MNLPSRPSGCRRVCAATAIILLAAPAWASADGTVVLRTGPRTPRARLAALGVRSVVGTVPGTGARLVRVAGDPAVVAQRLARVRGVAWAEPNAEVRALEAVPGDPRWPALYGVRRIGAPAFWGAHGLGGFPPTGGVPVGIVDTGVDAAHEDLRGKVRACGAARDGAVAEGDCADGDGHGTHVAGTIGAIAGNGAGVAGVAFDAPLIVCRALGGPGGSGTVADVAACMRWVHDRGARVISMSLGGPSSRTLAEAAKTAYARGGRSGSLLVAAAGNDGTGAVEFPAGLPQVISVGAIDARDAVAPFSNENADVELTAPGVDILSVKAGGGYVSESGTSMATPHVSGAAALLWGADPSASAATIRARLDAAVDDLGAPGRDAAYGFGVVDLARVR
ncbi:MAG TPA: S8 family peptidase [Solirubrobacteraceae bacterium]